ncbi:hypothetical protein AAC387_Pa06g0419 [Persea americana]
MHGCKKGSSGSRPHAINIFSDKTLFSSVFSSHQTRPYSLSFPTPQVPSSSVYRRPGGSRQQQSERNDPKSPYI